MSATPFDLTGKVALVTGTSRGLGQYMGRALARAGADLVVIATPPGLSHSNLNTRLKLVSTSSVRNQSLLTPRASGVCWQQLRRQRRRTLWWALACSVATRRGI